MMQTLTPYVQMFTMIVQFVILAMIGLNVWTMRRTFKVVDQYTELIGLFRSEMAFLMMRIEALEAKLREPMGGFIEQESFRGRSHSSQ